MPHYKNQENKRRKMPNSGNRKLIEEISSLVQSVNDMADSKGIKSFSEEESEGAFQLCETVIEHVPEFENYEDFAMWGKEDPYAHFGNFGDFLVELIEKSPENDPVVQRAMGFVNSSYNNSQHEFVRVILGTEVLEKLTASNRTTAAAQKYLKNAALKNFAAGLE